MPDTGIILRQKYWKFKANFQKDEQFCNAVRKILYSVKTNKEIDSCGKKWDFVFNFYLNVIDLGQWTELLSQDGYKHL